MSGENHHPSCPDCVPCSECGAIAYCVSEPNPFPPCTHNLPLCGDHNLEGCADCRQEAFADMAASGDYDPDADPLARPERRAADEAYWNSGPREVPGAPGTFGWDKS